MLGKGGRVGGEAEARPESKAVGERVRSGAGVGDAKAICATGGRKWEEAVVGEMFWSARYRNGGARAAGSRQE